MESLIFSIMKTPEFIVGLIVMVFAALLLANGIIMVVDPESQIFSQEVINIIIGFVLVVLAASYFNESKE